jgi:maleate cis-trans isomerase
VKAASRPLRIGLMVPANNTTMEGELLKWLPAGSSCRTLKIPRASGLLVKETVPAYKASALELSRQFANADLDMVVYGCTAAGFIYGPKGDAELASQLGAVTGKPVVTTASSMVRVLEACGAKQVAVVTPYHDHVNEQLTAFLAASEIRVKRLSSFKAANVEQLARITAGEVAQRARDTMGADCDALFIACSQLPTHAIVDDLCAELGRPVWSSIQASAWATAKVPESKSA